MNHYLLYLGAAYDGGAYGACTYQGDCTTTTGTGTDSGVGAPNTGFLTQPQIMVPLILGLAVLIAVLIFATKKIMRRLKNR